MTVLCPSGHESATTDYCDQCGAPIAQQQQQTAVLAPVEEADTSPARRQEPCPACGAPRSGDDRYCEGCGHDFLAPVATGARWEVVAGAGRAQFERTATAELSFPSDYAERRFELDSATVRIGRSRGNRGEAAPEIDLAGAVEDPGISRMHAVLEQQDDGSYAVRDLGSTNGTTVNDDPKPISTDVALPLEDGDRIGLGAWTTITVRSRAERGPRN